MTVDRLIRMKADADRFRRESCNFHGMLWVDARTLADYVWELVEEVERSRGPQDTPADGFVCDTCGHRIPGVGWADHPGIRTVMYGRECVPLCPECGNSGAFTRCLPKPKGFDDI